jgi:hypothetical protein
MFSDHDQRVGDQGDPCVEGRLLGEHVPEQPHIVSRVRARLAGRTAELERLAIEGTSFTLSALYGTGSCSSAQYVEA